MKKLYIVRHAKAAWEEGQTDFERSLSKRGRQDAVLMGDKLAGYSISPQYVLCSNARRTRETWEILSATLPGVRQVELSNDLYLASAQQMVMQVARLPEAVSSAMVIAHNPGVSMLTNYLIGEEQVNFPTLGIASLSLTIDNWQELSGGVGVLDSFIYPKMFKNTV